MLYRCTVCNPVMGKCMKGTKDRDRVHSDLCSDHGFLVYLFSLYHRQFVRP